MTAAYQQAGNYAADLDAGLYTPLECVVKEPYPLSFSRMVRGSRKNKIDVVLQEGPYISYIAEYPSYTKDCRYFNLELSFMNRGIVDAGWMLDSPAHFFLLYCPIWKDGTNSPVQLRALLIPKARLLQTLSRKGFNRAVLAQRDELLRQSNWSGNYKTSDPDILIQFRNEGERKPIFVQLSTKILEAIAAADFLVPMGDSSQPLKGNWLGQDVEFYREESKENGR